MKIRIVLSLVLIIFAIQSCTENNATTAFNDVDDPDITTVELSRIMNQEIKEYSGPVDRQQCCNNLYPSSPTPSTLMGIRWCTLLEDEVDITSQNCGYLYSHLVDSYPSDRLYFKACDEGDRTYSTAPVDWMTGTTSSGNPSLTWDFICGNGYKMERKEGVMGRWSTVMTTSDRQDTTWVDTEITVSAIEENVYYKVYSKVYSDYASSGPQKIYYPAK